ncbi:hypothetical protein Vadar_019213 [Vaccinium darrowii]|uniref:Uncharacterized protein n=1 Tax=Vaccinium darrowii TaxID=229202 RepID=A0ACB7ZKY3_9ERIC|nr:hypothetical protein Vadar_019213 [Vaccinium darrowii]
MSGKRIALLSNAEVMKKHCSEKMIQNHEKFLIESLPLDILIRILCGVDHGDLKRLFNVLKILREALVFSPSPRFSIYKASKGGLVSFFETLRTEVGSDIGITIVAPGVVESEITSAEFLAKAGIEGVPVESTEGCVKAIFKSICRGDRYLIEPAWMRMIHFWNLLCPEALKSFFSWVLINKPNYSTSNHNSGELKAD